jgi:hypothetical protein
MKSLAKWALIIWSILCIIGICAGIVNVSQQFSETQTDSETGIQALGLGCGLGIWLVIWMALAGPALAVYLVSGKKEAAKVEIVQKQAQVNLCPECGKYYEGQLKFCPHCGQEINAPKPKLSQPNPKPSARLCPKCGLPMEIKVANKGTQQGKSFYVCPNYKKCKQIFPV